MAVEPYLASWTRGTPSTIVVTDPEYGAIGDGVHDDTAAIQAAITDAAAQGGGIVVLPVGIFLAHGLQLPSYVGLSGSLPAGNESGVGVGTVLQLMPGSTDDLLVTTDFQSLTGTNSNGGSAGNVIRNITLDGNKANAPGGGWVLRRYGYRMILENVEIRNGQGGGLYTEWSTDGGAGADGGLMEDSWVNVRIHDCGGPYGLQHRGPHDSRISHFLVYNCAIGAIVQASASNTGVGLMLEHFHAYSNSGHGLVCEASVFGLSIESEGSASGDGIQILTNNCVLVGANTYNNNQNGITIGDSSSGAAFNTILGQSRNNGVSQIKFGGDNGGNQVIVSTYLGSGQSNYSGVPSVEDLAVLTNNQNQNILSQLNQPVGLIAAPSLPPSGTPYKNSNPYSVRVFISGGTVTGIALNGTATGLTSGMVMLCAGDTITLTYSSVPSWQWFGC